jgi:hypothetical protein
MTFALMGREGYRQQARAFERYAARAGKHIV